MSKTNKQDQKRIRRDFLRGYLTQPDRINHWLPLGDLIKAEKEMVASRQWGALSDRTCSRDIDEIKEEKLGNYAEYSVRRRPNEIGLFRTDTSPESEAERDHPEIKWLLSRLLMEQILDVVVSKEAPLPLVTPSVWPEWLKPKIDAIRTRTHISILLDAGSTTRACAALLLNAPDMPLNSRPEPADQKDKRVKFPRLVVPTLVTNSLTIADEVRKSRYNKQVRLRVIGGELRLDRSSLIGPYTELCAAAYKMRVDLVVLGCTGCRADNSGVLAFGVEDLNEARTKGACLEMGLGGLRVVICDSSKFKNTSVAHIFAPLSPHSIDLVVTDDGCKIGAEGKVQEFLYHAQQAQLPVLVLRTMHATAPAVNALAQDSDKAAPAEAAATPTPNAIAPSVPKSQEPVQPAAPEGPSHKRRKKK